MEPEYEPLIGSPVDAAPESTAHFNVSPYVSTGGVFLARGVATDVWLIDTPNIYDCKYVFKTVRLTLDTLKENCNPKGPRRVEQLWEDFIAAFKLKVQQWKILDHSHVVRLFGTMNSLGLCVEFCVNGTAPEYLETHSHGSSRLRKGMILDVLLGLEYIHSRTPPIVHGCLCMDKLFVDNYGTTKIGEFGLTALVEDFGVLAPGNLQVSRVRWMSPELFGADIEEPVPEPTTSSDVWAMGCTLFEIATGRLPYFRLKHELRVVNKILAKKPPGYRNECLFPELTDFWPLLAQCWRWEPEQRPAVRNLAQAAFSLVSGSKAMSWKDGPGADFTPLMTAGQGMHSYGQAEPESFAGIDPGTTGNFVPRSPQRLADRVSQGAQCDRCYASETRCVYEQSSNACTRCQRLRINCTSARSKSKSKTIHTNEWSENTLSLIPRPSGNTLSAYQTLSSWIPWNYDLTQIVTEGHQGTGDQLKARLRELAGKRNAIPAEPAWENRPLRRLVACIRCRKYRSKCIRDVPGTNVCQRCRESRSECRYTPLNRGKVPSSSTSRNLPGLRISSVITDEDAENLFTIFREKMNGGIMIFDDTIHTPAVLKSRCPVLFTTICAVVSHYWVESLHIYLSLISEAITQIETALNTGLKSVDICQACLLLSIHPPRSSEGSKPQSYLDSAIRLGMELDLGNWSLLDDLDETSQRESLNKARTWLVCLKMDRMLASRCGRLVSTSQEDLLRYSDWWHLSQFNSPLDLHLYYETRALDAVAMKYTTKLYSMLSQPTVGIDDFNLTVQNFDMEMQVYQREAEQACTTEQEMPNLGCRYQQELFTSTIIYSRLVILSFGLDYFWNSEDQHVTDIFLHSIKSASELLHVSSQMMSSYECHQHSSQFYWKQGLIAAAFLIKILKSEKVLLPHIRSSITEENYELLSSRINNYITMLTHDSSANGLDLTRHGIMLRDMWEVGDSNTLAPELGTPTPVDHSISLFWESPAGLGAPDQPGTSNDSPAV